MMVKRTEKHRTHQPLTRRQFRGITVGAGAGLAGVLSLHQPPAIHAETREINVLTTANYVPASDKKLAEQV